MTTTKRTATQPAHGFICKRCHGPAPMGVGYAANEAGAAAASAKLTRCQCGYSIDPATL